MENNTNVNNLHLLTQFKMNELEQMENFVQSRGGLVRFDDYMHEHNFGPGGFYSSRVNIGHDGHFRTKTLISGFSHLIYLAVKEMGLDSLPFVEIGGGNGAFKEGHKLYHPGKYVSIDASPRLTLQQKNHGGYSITADARDLPLSDDDRVVFSNELLDELPVRIFRLRRSQGQPYVSEEANIDSNLDLTYLPVEEDEFTTQYNEYLRQRKPKTRPNTVVSVSPDTQKVIQEMARIAGDGAVVIIDYGYKRNSLPYFEQKKRELPFFREDTKIKDLDEILRRPYQVDFTYNVDFQFVEWIAERLGLQFRIKYQHDFFYRLLIEHELGGEPYEPLILECNLLAAIIQP
tara:strand:+ start:14622 stop:15659 length:1038 start_codon:yes stop_codon:yes gene_type:complete